MAVLTQQVQRRVRGIAPLALKGDEDGSARELQQPAQALPAGRGCQWGAAPPPPRTPHGTYRKLWLHQARPRKASDSTTMRRRQRLKFTSRSAEGSAGTGHWRGRGPTGGRDKEGGGWTRDGGGAQKGATGAGREKRWGPTRDEGSRGGVWTRGGRGRGGAPWYLHAVRGRGRPGRACSPDAAPAAASG